MLYARPRKQLQLQRNCVLSLTDYSFYFEQQVARCARLEKRIEELESGGTPPSDKQRPDQSYLAETVEERKKRRTKLKKKRAGRKKGQDKLREATRWVDVLPENATKEDCELQSERPVWRLEDGRATRVGYRVYRRPWQEAPSIPGVIPRCEYGVEIHVVLAYLVYVIGVSMEKACQLLEFFCELPIRRSQADAMLTQLGKHWSDDFDAICERIANMQPDKEDYREYVRELQPHPWDKWCWDRYVSPDTGSAFLVKVWNGARFDLKLKKTHPEVRTVFTWSPFARMHAAAT